MGTLKANPKLIELAFGGKSLNLLFTVTYPVTTNLKTSDNYMQ